MPPQLSAIKRIEIIARQTPGVVSLAQGVPFLPSSSFIRDAACQAIQQGKVDRYSLGVGIPELREKISDHLKDREMMYDPKTEIIVTAGAIESLSTIFLSLLSKNDEVVVFTPTYFANYKSIISMAGGKPIPIPLIENRSWHIDFHLLEKSITKKTRAIIICNPNNPTGSVLFKEDLIKLGDLALKNNLLLLMDDVYSEFSYNGAIYNLCQEKRFKNNVLRIVSFSKIYSLSGWRIAFVHGPKEYIQKLLPFHDNLINCAPVVSQYAALAGLSHHKKIITANLKIYRHNREIVMKELDKLASYFSYTIPEGAYYIFPKLKNSKDDVKFCFDVLQKAKVAIVPGIDFGPGGEGHIRICFGKSEEEIIEGMKRLGKYLQ